MSKNDSTAAIEQAKPQQPVPVSVTLDSPIVRGDQTIEQLTLRKPMAGELRGVALADLMKLDVSALCIVLPRISSPVLTTHDVQQMDLADLAQVGTEVVGFFLTKADRAALSPAG